MGWKGLEGLIPSFSLFSGHVPPHQQQSCCSRHNEAAGNSLSMESLPCFLSLACDTRQEMELGLCGIDSPARLRGSQLPFLAAGIRAGMWRRAEAPGKSTALQQQLGSPSGCWGSCRRGQGCGLSSAPSHNPHPFPSSPWGKQGWPCSAGSWKILRTT